LKRVARGKELSRTDRVENISAPIETARITVSELYMTSMEKFDMLNLIPSLNVDRKS